MCDIGLLILVHCFFFGFTHSNLIQNLCLETSDSSKPKHQNKHPKTFNIKNDMQVNAHSHKQTYKGKACNAKHTRAATQEPQNQERRNRQNLTPTTQNMLALPRRNPRTRGGTTRTAFQKAKAHFTRQKTTHFRHRLTSNTNGPHFRHRLPSGMSQLGTRTCADGMGAREKLEIGKVGNGWEEGPVDMSERGSWTCANGMGAREKVGNG